MSLSLPRRALFLDTETTGFEGRIIELAWAELEGAIWSIRFKPPVPIEEDALAVHGITEESLEGLPAFIDHPRYAELKELIEGSVIFAHSARFDIGMLAKEGIVVRNYVDTKAVAKKLYPTSSSVKLQSLRDILGIEIEGVAHSASGDVAVLRELYKRMALDSLLVAWRKKL